MDKDSNSFSWSLQYKYRDSTLNWAMTGFFHIISNSLFINHSIIRHYTLQDGINNYKFMHINIQCYIVGMTEYKV
jgi:hypothetical protein